MSWKFFKRDPSIDLGAYFVEIQNERIDFDDPVIQKIVDDLGGLASWPQLTLQQFKDFTEQLRVKVALSTGEIVEIGDVNYLSVDPDTNKAQDTGLSWDDATVTPNMENFVVSTIEQVLNDEDIRVDEQISYPQIENAMVQLISAAETLTDFDDGDMPMLPDSDAYTTALEENQKLNIQPRKFTDGPSVSAPVEKPKQSLEINDLPSASMPEPTVADKPLVPSVPLGVAPIAPTAPVAPAEPSAKEVATSEPATVKAMTDNALLDKIQQFQVNVPSFSVDEQLLTDTVAPEDERYVDVMVARQKAEANQVLSHAAADLTAATHRDLMKVATQAKLNTEEIDKLLSDDWQAPLTKQIAHKQQQAFANRLAETRRNLTAAYDDDVARENTRHDNTLADLKRQYDVDVDKLTTQNELDRERTIESETARVIAQQSLYIDKEIATLQQQAEELATHQIIDEMVSRQTEAEGILADALEDISGKIENDRQQYLSEHESALEARRIADEATAKNLQAQRANYDLAALETSKHSLEAERVSLQEKVVKLQAESAKWQAQAEGKQSDLERLTARVAELTQGEQQTALIAALAGSRQPEPAPAAPTAKNSFVKGALASAAILLGIGGIGYGTYHVVDTQNKAEASVKAAEASYNAKTVVLQKQLKKSVQSSEKATKTSSSSATASSKATSKQDFSQLDADVKNGSLKSYYQSFDKANLATEERTLAVGKLLINAKQLADAKQLAAANDGHSNQLLALINKQ